jgi:hypothetical protein
MPEAERVAKFVYDFFDETRPEQLFVCADKQPSRRHHAGRPRRMCDTKHEIEVLREEIPVGEAEHVRCAVTAHEC